jgi:histidyl-tRNA synthetase
VQIPMQGLGEQLRDALPGLRLMVNSGGGSFKSQFKKADRSGAGIAIILGEEEHRHGMVAIKFLRDAGAQQVTVKQEELSGWIRENLQLQNHSKELV